ncbi:MAG: aspartate carbamoyltransferase catalytic subunit [Paracoccaceae bacterium]
MNAIDAWTGILDEGEDILWQGRPLPSFSVTGPAKVFELLFGLLFAGFALFWMIMASQSGGGFWMFGIIHFIVGIGGVFHAIGWSRFRHGRTWYTLTNRRSFIATELPVIGKRLNSYPITKSTALELVDATPPSVYFASETRRTRSGTRRVQIGFEQIADGMDVYRLMRSIQTGASTGSTTT